MPSLNGLQHGLAARLVPSHTTQTHLVLTGIARITAALIALAAWTGLAAQFGAVYGRTASAVETAWSMAGYFTVLTNLLVGVIFAGIAFGTNAFMAPRLLAGIALAIVLVAVIHALLLRGLIVLSGGDAFADVLLHWFTPALVPIFWGFFVPKGALRPYDPLYWVIYPLAYLFYALMRGAAGGHYAYPFIDVIQLGWWQMIINATTIAIAFLVAGYVLVVLDHQLCKRPPA